MTYFAALAEDLDHVIGRYHAALEACRARRRAARRVARGFPVSLGLLALFSGVNPLSTEAGGASSPIEIPFRSVD